MPERTSALCSPGAGAVRRNCQGDSVRRYGAPGYTMDGPPSEDSTVVRYPLLHSCSLSRISSGVAAGPHGWWLDWPNSVISCLV